MIVNGKPYRSIWYDSANESVKIIDQTLLPHHFEIKTINNVTEMVEAIKAMRVRGAPLIGVAAAFGLYLALREDPNSKKEAIDYLLGARPTAVNLAWAMGKAEKVLESASPSSLLSTALNFALALADDDVRTCEAIGVAHKRIEERYALKGLAVFICGKSFGQVCPRRRIREEAL